jgi:hypothetical protein
VDPDSHGSALQCCGTGAAGKATFCLVEEPKPECNPVLEQVFGFGYNLKWNTEVKKIKNERQTFWEIMLFLMLERQD